MLINHQNSLNSRYFAWIALAITLALTSSCIFSPRRVTEPDESRSIIQNYQIINNESPFSKLWVSTDNYIFAESGHAFLGVTGKTLCMYTRNNMRLQCLNIESGEEKWGLIRTGFSFAQDSKYVFISPAPVYDTSRDANIWAFDIEDGGSVWWKEIRDGRNISSMSASEENLFLHSTISPTLRIIDSQTSWLIYTQDETFGGNLITLRNGIAYVDMGHKLSAVDVETKATKWETSKDDVIYYEPRFTDDVIYFKTGDETSGAIYAIDLENGELLWQKENVVSRVAANSNAAFYLTSDSTLEIVDPQTGMTQYEIQFSPALQSNLNEMELAHTHYIVEATDDYLVVYFDETHQLFAFKFALSGAGE